MQAQETEGRIIGIEITTEPSAQILRLFQTLHRELSTPLRDDEHLRNLPHSFALLLLRLPLRRFQLHLLLQYRVPVMHREHFHEQLYVPQLGLQLCRRRALVAVGLQLAELRPNLTCNSLHVNIQSLHLGGCLETDFRAAVLLHTVKVFQKNRLLAFELELLLGSAISVAHHHQHAPQSLGLLMCVLLLNRVTGRPLGESLPVVLFVGVHDRRRIQASAFDLHLVQKMQTHQLAAIVIISLVALDERPTIDITYDRTAISTEDVEAANILPESTYNQRAYGFLSLCEDDRIPDLLAILGPLDLAIHSRCLPRLRVDVVHADSVDLDVRPLRRKEGLVDVFPIPSNRVLLSVELAGLVLLLSEKLLRPTSDGPGVVDPNIVAVPVEGLLDERFRKLLAV
mmetsp:Transcript_17180/g.46530  ORF Transcript_17180/g.46530 Transcript_17180/m.46530 type:complete len:398 (-) Transcript_17180:12-1205(-)